jgi:hypothetical protein
MKIKCKICKDAPVIDLGEPFLGKEMYCSYCGNIMAVGEWSDEDNAVFWKIFQRAKIVK